MEPATGERLVRFVGDRIHFTLHDGSGRNGWRALLRTNLGRATARRRPGSRRRILARRADATKRRCLANRIAAR